MVPWLQQHNLRLLMMRQDSTEEWSQKAKSPFSALCGSKCLWNDAYSRTMGSGLCGRIRAITRQEDEQQKQICESVEKWASGFCIRVHKSTASASQRGLWGFKVTIKLRMWIRARELSWLAVRELEKSQSKHAKCNYVFRFEMTCWGVGGVICSCR